MDGVERKFHVMDVNNEPASGSRLVEFIQVVDDTKMKKQALKVSAYMYARFPIDGLALRDEIMSM